MGTEKTSLANRCRAEETVAAGTAGLAAKSDKRPLLLPLLKDSAVE